MEFYPQSIQDFIRKKVSVLPVIYSIIHKYIYFYAYYIQTDNSVYIHTLLTLLIKPLIFYTHAQAQPLSLFLY